MSRPPHRGAGRTQQFGNRDTAKKQGVVVSYLAAYLRVMSKQPFHLSYVDAFAGCGARIDAAESETEPPRVRRRLFCLGHAARAAGSSWV